MKRIKLIILIIALTTFASYGGTYMLASASYPINVNGTRLAATPLNYNGTTYLPLRTIAEATGVPISWSGNSVEINTLDVNRLKEACVMIHAENYDEKEQGSGVYWDYGEILTANHVVDGKLFINTDDGAALQIKETSTEIDIASLETDTSIKPVKIGDSDEVKVGDKVLIIGAPGGKEDTEISATVKKLTNEIVVSVSLSGGGSGSAVFDTKGSLIGIVLAKDDGLNETYITPINAIRKSL